MAKSAQHDILLESGTNELEILVFHVLRQRYGVNVAKVREVIEPVHVTTLPQSHDAVIGVFQLRNTVTPLINLGRCLSKEGSDFSAGTIVIMEFNDTRIGFLVDGVEQIYRVSWKDVDPVPDLEGVHDTPVTSIAHIQDDMVLMLDFEKLVFDIGGVDLFAQSAERVQKNPDRGDQRILLAEDSHVMRMLIKSNLIESGYNNIKPCIDGQDAWDRLESGVAIDGVPPFDLVITDIEMPRIDGLHLTRRIKKHPQLKHLPVIVFSSLVSPDNTKKCEAVGADAQITKPQLSELVSLIDGLLAKAHNARTADRGQEASPPVAAAS